MADNITLSTGEVVATKDIAGVHFQKTIPYNSSGVEITPALAAQLPATIGPKAAAAAMAVTTATDDIKYIDVTLSLDTSAYAASDLLADAQIVEACVKANDANGVLQSMVVLDEDDNGQPIDFFFANASSSFGTENSAPTITDANARTILGRVSVAAADYFDLGNMKMAFKGNIGMVVTPIAGSDDIYIAAVLPSTASSATYTASGIRLRLGFLG